MSIPVCVVRGTFCRQHPVVLCVSPPVLHWYSLHLQCEWAACTGRPATASRAGLFYRLLCDLHYHYHAFLALVVAGPCHQLSRLCLHRPLLLRVSKRALCPALDTFCHGPDARVLVVQRILPSSTVQSILSLA